MNFKKTSVWNLMIFLSLNSKSRHFLKIKPSFDEVCCLVSKVGKLLNSSLIVFNILESSTYSMRKEKSSAINHFSGYTHLLIYYVLC